MTLHQQPLSFTSEQEQEITRILEHLGTSLQAPLIMLSDISGRLLLSRSRLTPAQSIGLSALGAGIFGAGVEIGHFLSLPKSFQQLLLEGKLANLYLVALGEELLLLVAFTKHAPFAKVQKFAKIAQKALTIVADEAVQQRKVAATEIQYDIDQEFKQELDQELTMLFDDELPKKQL